MSTNTPSEKGTPQSRTYTVNDIAAILGIGRATAYKLVNSGAFKTIRIGNMIRISRKSFEDWLKMAWLDDETK
ncbi:helix-turn-helix domain-containing protein [Pseudoflavonifractor capillosus]|uniref:helix-turn-helix domain-containing protein n=1 Tax=Pseudoflavonifractor capillosus TaxID=106588 RepID=UPI00195DA002|nr:helix-turn-helix domain-containing protein [Pseudoflavonifractor capillosus]MBM6897929.1 helix-turn-helix domain-containing protein [Pseudoflavonifractor capillosus]